MVVLYVEKRVFIKKVTLTINSNQQQIMVSKDVTNCT